MENSSNHYSKHLDHDLTEQRNGFEDLISSDDHKINATENQVPINENMSHPAQNQRSFLGAVHFPHFSFLKSDFLEEGEPNYRQKFLEDMEKYPNQERSRQDFLDYLEQEYLSSQGYSSIKAQIQEFEGKGSDWEIDNVLEWLAKDYLLRQVVADALRIGTWDPIHSCRWILRSAKNAYEKKANNFSGMICSKVLINDLEWEKLKKGIGQQIQLYGILSARKIQNEIELFDDNTDEKTLISIIVPAFPDNQGQKKCLGLTISKDGRQSDELLFNMLSKFRILEAREKNTNGSSHHHLVLLFGDDEMQEFLRVKQPIIEIKLDKTKNMECLICNSSIDIAQEPVFYIDLCKTSQYVCKNCVKENQYQNKSPLLCVYSSTQLLFEPSEEQEDSSLIVDGFATQYQLEDKNVPFYGYKCSECLRTTDLKYFYKCLSCLETKIPICVKCMNKSDDCVKKGHIIILESQPFTFWSKCISEEKFDYLRSPPKDLPTLFERDQILESRTQLTELETCSSKLLGKDYNKLEVSLGTENESIDKEDKNDLMDSYEFIDTKNTNKEDLASLYELFCKLKELFKSRELLSEKDRQYLGLEVSSNITDKNPKIEQDTDSNKK